MMHPNEQVVRQQVEAFRAGDPEAIRATFADDVVAHFPVYHLRDEKIAEIWMHEGDQYALDEFFSD